LRSHDGKRLVKFFLPDSRDSVDTTFDFTKETRSPDRIPRDELYIHEMLDRSVDGLLVSYAGLRDGRYSAAARRRFMREGARGFFRAAPWMSFMGDPGAFSYIKESEPPVTVSEVAEFYGSVGIDLGMAVDHIVSGYSDELFEDPDPEQQRRYDLTLALASDFLAAAKPHAFEPVGVVQGWSPASYARAAAELQRMGYGYLALGGLVRLNGSWKPGKEHPRRGLGSVHHDPALQSGRSWRACGRGGPQEYHA
jgi:hypothetical protein